MLKIWSSFWGLVRSLAFVWVYTVLAKGIPGKGVDKGIVYGFLVWLVGAFAGIITMPLYMTINSTVVYYWIGQALVLNIINGALVAKLHKEK